MLLNSRVHPFGNICLPTYPEWTGPGMHVAISYRVCHFLAVGCHLSL